MESAEEYEVSYLMELPTELLVGTEGNPGLLVMLAYPDLMRLREVSMRFRDIIDSDYFWKLKTRRDWGSTNPYPSRSYFYIQGKGKKSNAEEEEGEGKLEIS